MERGNADTYVSYFPLSHVQCSRSFCVPGISSLVDVPRLDGGKMRFWEPSS
jgi:hypothetical protein